MNKMPNPFMKLTPAPHLVTGPHGIGPIHRTLLHQRMSLLKRVETFLSNKAQAVSAAKNGDRHTARFWGAMARFDWSLIAEDLARPTL